MESTYLIAKGILKPFLAGWFRWSIEGLDNIPRKGPALLAFNHISYLDPLATAYVVDKSRRVPRFLAKSELFADRRIAWILRGARQIPVQRGTADAPMAMDEALASLERGEIIVIFPEGTITNDPELNPMEGKTGAARLALGSDAPLIPCGVWGTQNIWPKGYSKRWWPPRQDILVRVGEPMEVSGDPNSPDAWRSVTSNLMARIEVLVASLRPAVPDRRRPRRAA
ncbi:MAG TPA: lysophospholipid acyltransferase family protein [Actinomycetota bacterium]|nr:lysophospholipid acyltransferase family protein [Actinomycetota bacterium]